MMYMDVQELKMLCGDRRVDELIARGRIPLAKVDEELVIMDRICDLEAELNDDNEDLLRVRG
jgi:hypothetical protein